MTSITTSEAIPKTQTVALVRKLGGPVEFDHNYPVPVPGPEEVLAKVLYTGVCQSDLHTAAGTASSPDGSPITSITLPHIGGHEGVGRLVALGTSIPTLYPDIHLNKLVGIRFISRVCHTCEYCLQGTEQYCTNATNHLHHEAGSFQEYIVLGARDLIVLPKGADPRVMGPVLCAGVTAFKAVKNTSPKPDHHIVILGAGGGLGVFATQYALLHTKNILCIDTPAKSTYLTSLGAAFLSSNTPDLVAAVHKHTSGGAHALICTTGSATAVANAADLLRVGGVLSICGIPVGGGRIDTKVAAVAIRGLCIRGNLVGSGEELLRAVELVVQGKVRPKVQVRRFEELGEVYEELLRGEVVGRVVLKVAKDEGVQVEVERARL